MHYIAHEEPDNIGFDVRGDVKIFDFGLARGKDTIIILLSSISCLHLIICLHFSMIFKQKEFPKSELMSGDTYQMSGKTGSLRYMVSVWSALDIRVYDAGTICISLITPQILIHTSLSRPGS